MTSTEYGETPPSYQLEQQQPNYAHAPPLQEGQQQPQLSLSSLSGPPKFCSECGKKVDGRFCSNCGYDVINNTKVNRSQPNQQNNNIVAVDNTGPRMDQAVLTHNGTRLLWDFEKHTCCGDGQLGLYPGARDNLPPELRSKGITEQQWREWLDELDDIQKKISPTICCVLSTLCCPGGILQCILCATFCPLSSNHCFSCLPCCFGDWHAAIRQWQERVNAILIEYGMYVKLKSFKPWRNAPESKYKSNRGNGKDDNYEFSTMEISLTPAATNLLRCEPWDNGINDVCTSGRGRAL